MITLNAETASEYDFIIGLDASGSMLSQSKRFAGRTRWQEAQETILGLTAAIEPYDADGIDIVVFGGDVKVHEGVTSAKVADLFATRAPRGSTPLADALSAIVTKQKRTGKNTVAIVFTDGDPDSQEAAVKVITNAANAIEKDEALTFLFVQIGDDPGAGKFLAFLDDGITAKFDIVDALTAAVADTMEPIDLINKAIND